MKIFFELDTEKDDIEKKLEELRNIEKLFFVEKEESPLGLTSKDMAF